MNLKQAARATGLSRQKLKALIHAGTLPAIRGPRVFEIAPADLERIVGLPDVMTEQRQLRDQVNALRQEVLRLSQWQTRAQVTMEYLLQRVGGPRLTRREVARWLGTHGFNADSLATHKQLPLQHERPINQQESALRYAYTNYQRHQGRYPGTIITECTDPDCICHTILPTLPA